MKFIKERKKLRQEWNKKNPKAKSNELGKKIDETLATFVGECTELR